MTLTAQAVADEPQGIRLHPHPVKIQRSIAAAAAVTVNTAMATPPVNVHVVIISKPILPIFYTIHDVFSQISSNITVSSPIGPQRQGLFHPVHGPVFCAVHKAVFNQITPERHIVRVNFSERLVDLRLCITAPGLELLDNTHQYGKLALSLTGKCSSLKGSRLLKGVFQVALVLLLRHQVTVVHHLAPSCTGRSSAPGCSPTAGRRFRQLPGTFAQRQVNARLLGFFAEYKFLMADG